MSKLGVAGKSTHALNHLLTNVMEDLVVAMTWQSTLLAAVCAAGIGVESAQASPAGMTAHSAQPATPATPAAAPVPRVADARGVANAVSPWKRITNAIPEVHVPWAKNDANHAPPVMSDAPPHVDAISLSTPAGPATPQLVISVAQNCEQRGDVAQARQQYQNALRHWPGHPEVLRAAAQMEDRLGQLTVAENLYRQVVASTPDNPEALCNLGVCLGRQGRLDESVQTLEQAILLAPEKVLYRNNAALVLVEMRQDQRAIGHLAAVHGPAETQYNMGQLLVARSRAAESEPYFERALDINPDMNDARAAIAQLDRRNSQQTAAPIAATSAPARQTQGVAAAAPTTAPVVVPQQNQTAPMLGPQMNFPSEARASEYGRSTYQAPQYAYPQYPMGANGYSAAMPPSTPNPNVPWVGQATPRALPPVGGQTNGVRR